MTPREPDLILFVGLDMTGKYGNRLPFIQAACFAENVIAQEEKSGSTTIHSLIRLVDIFGVHIPKGLPPDTRGVITLKLFVSVKSGDVTGDHKLGLVLHHPDPDNPEQIKRSAMPEAPVKLGGGTHGHAQTYNINLEVSEKSMGDHVFDVMWDGELLTRVPFTLRVQQEDAPQGPQKS